MTSLFARVLILFRLRPPQDGGAGGPQARQSVSVISVGSSLKGSIDAPGSLRVEGRLVGDVRVQGTVEVVKGASITGTELRCRDLLVAGSVEAKVFASGSVTIVSGGGIQGDLVCRGLQAPRGAEFQGRLTLGDLPAEGGIQKHLPAAPEVPSRVPAFAAAEESRTSRHLA